jgi:hypothetical protein
METHALIGDPRALARALAAELLKELQLHTIEPAMNVTEAAAFLKISADQVRELAELGKIPAFNAATPGSTAKHWRFWKHQLANLGDLSQLRPK